MSLAEEVVRLVAARGGDVHWTVVLDDALRGGAVVPSPDARAQVLRALAEAERAGAVRKSSIGTYRLP